MSKIGILDPDGNNMNPLTNKPYSQQYKDISKKWSSLPAYKEVDMIMETIINNQVLLVVSGTGSGKTVLVPKFALHTMDYKGRIAITLPKKLVALSAAEFSALTLDVKLGEEVGYQYRGSEGKGRSSKTKLLYATDGTIVQRLLNDPRLSDFDMVIIDEAHERKIQIDLLLFLLKGTLLLRPDFKLIIMSATINTEIFADYYKEYRFKSIYLSGGSHYPIKSIYLDQPINVKNYLNYGMDIILKIIDKNSETYSRGDILFFITSSNEAMDICLKLNIKLGDMKLERKTLIPNTDINLYRLNSNFSQEGDTFFCLEVFAGMSEENSILATTTHHMILNKEDDIYRRKIAIATNVAESSLTIDGIKYIIESGYELSSTYDPKMRAKRLDKERITKAQIKQRMGRTGRTEPGICYHLYTEKEYDELKEFPDPDIRTRDLTGELLKLMDMVDKIDKAEDKDGIYKLIEILDKFIEPPRKLFVNAGLKNLTRLGAIQNNEISKLGKKMIEFTSLDPMFSYAMILAWYYNCRHEVTIILIILDNIKNHFGDMFKPIKIDPYINNPEKEKSRKKALLAEAKKKFKHKYGDHLTILNIYQAYSEKKAKTKNDKKKMREWCDKYFLKESLLHSMEHKIKMAEDKLVKVMKNNDTDIISKSSYISGLDKVYKILYCLMKSHKLNYAKKKDGYFYVKHAHNEKLSISKDSVFSLTSKLPTKCFYTEMFITQGKPELNIVSLIPDKLEMYYKREK